MPKTQSHDPDLDDLPGFGAPPAVALPDEPPDDEIPPEAREPENTPPSTTSSSPSPSASAPEPPNDPPPRTATSTEPDDELIEGLEFLAAGLFELVGRFINRMVKVRRHQQTTLWLVTDEESDAFAAPMARIAERRLPDELKSGDAKDLVIAGSVAVEYAVHNAAGEPGIEPDEPQHFVPPPPPPPPAAQAPQPPSAPATQQADTAPPDAPPLIAPDL